MHYAGKHKLFSEQQLMDCSWGYGLNKACDGGDYDAAFDYLKLAGGPIGEAEYEYLGADGFCRDQNHSNLVTSGAASFEVRHREPIPVHPTLAHTRVLPHS